MDSESEADDAMGGTVGRTGEEASLGASGSSEAGRRTTNTMNFIGKEETAGTEVVTIKLRGTESSDPISAVLGWNFTTQ